MSDVDYGQYEAGQESAGVDQLHTETGAEADSNSQFGVYEQDHSAAENTDYSHGSHQLYEAPSGERYESEDYTNYSHNAEVDDHVFAAEGSEESHAAQFSSMDALQERMDAMFERGTEFRGTDMELAAN